jgi:hypothetical protein
MMMPLLTIIIIVFLVPTCMSWTFSTTNLNLAYPPPGNSGYAVENGKQVGPDVLFPCGAVPVDPSQSRFPFPISSGAFTYSLANTSVGSLKDYAYYVMVYLGQISLGNGTYSSSQAGINAGFSYADTEVWKDFATGCQYSSDFDAVPLVNQALGTQFEVGDLVGMNATWGVRIVLFAPNPLVTYQVLDDINQEEMYQVSRILTNEQMHG